MINERGKTYLILFTPGLLTILFVILKLCKVIKWSWVWILCPMWISLVLGLLLCVGLVVIEKVRWRRWYK